MNYAPLDSVVTKADIKAFKARQPKKSSLTNLVWLGVALIMVVVTLIIFMGAFVGSGGDRRDIPMFVPFVWVGSFIGFGLLVLFASQKHLQRLVRLERFAQANGMQLRYDQKDPGYAGMIFDEGHTRELKEALVLTDGTEIGNYQYVTGSGKNRSTHSYGYIRIPLARALPHMVLDARSNNMFGSFSNLPDTFSADQTLALEGDFSKHFTLYAPKQYERDALYVFTPDVMAKLIDEGSSYDMEVIGTELYIYSGGRLDLADKTKLSALFGIVTTIAAELRDQTEYYADERVGDRSANIIAPQGAKLKHGVNYLVIGIVVTFFVMQFVGQFWPQAGVAFSLLLGTFIWGAIIFSVVKKVRN